MAVVVMKFGGTSVANVERIRNVARHVKREVDGGNEVAVVVSAMAGVTNQLVAFVREASILHDAREYDAVVATGEQVAAGLLAIVLQAMGLQARSWQGWQIPITTTPAHGAARISGIDGAEIRRRLDHGEVAVVTGFQGIEPERRRIATLGRGGSDTSAVAMAVALRADVCDIYTDVDGVYTTDPRIVPQARKIDRISYNEMLELASLGAGVMHSRAIEFGLKYNVPIHVRSSLTDTPGTMIVAETEGMEAIAVRGATLSRKLARVFLKGVPNEPGMAARIFAHIGRHNVVVDDIIQVSQPEAEKADLGFTVNADEAAEAKIVCEDIAKELGFDAVEVDNDVAKVSVVGIGMRTHTGVAAKMFGALADGGISIEDITTSEIVIGCLIRRADADRALQLVHKAFALDQEPDAA